MVDGPCPKDCNYGFMELPAGWELAPYSKSLVREVVAKYGFGTQVVVFANGHGYGKNFGSGRTKYGNNLLRMKGASYKPNGCPLKVLMRIPLSKLICNNSYKGIFQS